MSFEEIIAFCFLGAILLVCVPILIWVIKLDDKQKNKRIENERKRNELLDDINEKLFIMISKDKE